MKLSKGLTVSCCHTDGSFIGNNLRTGNTSWFGVTFTEATRSSDVDAASLVRKAISTCDKASNDYHRQVIVV